MTILLKILRVMENFTFYYTVAQNSFIISFYVVLGVNLPFFYVNQALLLFLDSIFLYNTVIITYSTFSLVFLFYYSTK